MSLLDSSMHEAVGGGFAAAAKLPYFSVGVPPDHTTTPTCPVYQPPPES